MSVDVNQAIQELLYEQTAVIVPGLGGFTSMAGAATVDYVQDIVQPPASKLEFNPNLVVNDGVLVQYLQKTNVTTYQDAGKMIERFVSSVKETLERREIFEIPKVGRLYKDYEHKIRFMPEGTNFNADSFGLPTVEFQPLVKEKPKPAPAPPPSSFVNPAIPATSNGDDAANADMDYMEATPTSMLQKILPWAVLVAAFLVAFALFKLFSGPDSGAQANLPEKERINVKPTLPTSEGDQVTSSDEAAPTPPPVTDTKPSAEKPKESAVPEGADTEQDVFEPSKQKIYLVVHSFGMKSNATNFAQKLTEDGYATETKQAGKLYRVGVNVPYKTQQDIEKTRKELAAKYKAGPKTEKELEEMGN